MFFLSNSTFFKFSIFIALLTNVNCINGERYDNTHKFYFYFTIVKRCRIFSDMDLYKDNSVLLLSLLLQTASFVILSCCAPNKGNVSFTPRLHSLLGIIQSWRTGAWHFGHLTNYLLRPFSSHVDIFITIWKLAMQTTQSFRYWMNDSNPLFNIICRY